MIDWFRRQSRLRKLALGGVAFTLLVVAYWVVTFLQVWSASRTDDARPSDAIVVLGAAQYDGRPSPVLQKRLDHALALYEGEVAPLIVVTGGRQTGDRFTEATSGYNYLRSRGVPDSALRKEVQGKSTYESIAATARFLHSEGIDRVVLISGRAQSKRMEGIAAEVGLDAVVSPTGTSPTITELAKESFGVSLGRIISYRRLESLTH